MLEIYLLYMLESYGMTRVVCSTKVGETLGYGRVVEDVKSEVGATFMNVVYRVVRSDMGLHPNRITFDPKKHW